MHFQIAREGRQLSVLKRSFEFKLGILLKIRSYENIDSYLHAVFKVRRFLFSAFLLTLEIVETCAATIKKFSLGNLKASL